MRRKLGRSKVSFPVLPRVIDGTSAEEYSENKPVGRLEGHDDAAHRRAAATAVVAVDRCYGENKHQAIRGRRRHRTRRSEGGTRRIGHLISSLLNRIRTCTTSQRVLASSDEFARSTAGRSIKNQIPRDEQKTVLQELDRYKDIV